MVTLERVFPGPEIHQSAACITDRFYTFNNFLKIRFYLRLIVCILNNVAVVIILSNGTKSG